MTSTKSSTGRTSRALGLAWQAQLDAYHAHLRVTRAGLMVQVPTEALVMGATRKDGRGRTTFAAAWAARASVDYVGSVVRDGRPEPVYLEAKTCVTERWNFADALGARVPHGPQWSTLAAADAMDAHALVALWWMTAGRTPTAWLWEWATLAELRERGVASVTEGECAAWSRRIVVAQWVDAMETAADAEEVRL
jgi:hypothetical protein